MDFAEEFKPSYYQNKKTSRSHLLPRERHQRWVQHYGQQQMARCYRCHGQDGNEVLDLPVGRDETSRGKDDHAEYAQDGKGHAELEALEHLGHLDEEVGEFHFLRGGTPRHVDFEHVGK